MGKNSKQKTPRKMQDNTAAVEEEKHSPSAKKLLNHWLRFSSGLPYILVLIYVSITGHMKSHLILLSATGTLGEL